MQEHEAWAFLLKVVADFISATAWPLMLAALAVIFRKELRGWIDSVAYATEGFELGPAGVRWKRRQAAEDRKVVDDAAGAAGAAIDLSADALDRGEGALLVSGPAGAVIDAINDLERRLSIQLKGEPGASKAGIHGLMNIAKKKNLLTEEEAALNGRFYRVRRAAQRSGDVAVSPESAREIVAIIATLEEKLASASGGAPK